MVVVYCCVPGCFNNSVKNSEVVFHRFPKTGRLRSGWIAAIRRQRQSENFIPQDFHRVCGDHFEDGVTSSKVPSIFPSAKVKTPSRYSFFGHKLQHNVGIEAMKQQPLADNSQDEFITLNSSESDTEVSGEKRKHKANAVRLVEAGPSSDTTELSSFGTMTESNCLGLSQQLRKLSVGNVNKFLENWTPEGSTRETRKLTRKIYTQSSKARSRYYDENGFLMKSGKDVCDCLEEDCPGCHFPCPKCSSPKCGHECRVNRRWAYDSIEIEGKEEVIKNMYRYK